MHAASFALVLLLLPVSSVVAQDAAQDVRFTSVDIFLDSGRDALAAYRAEVTTTGDAQFVGVAGGEHPAFKIPPHYDPAALRRGGRIILAAFSLSADLPAGRTRVASLQMREVGKVTYQIRLLEAGRADDTPIRPAVQIIPEGRR